MTNYDVINAFYKAFEKKDRDNGTRSDYVEQARQDGLIAHESDIYTQIACGMYLEIQEIYNRLITELCSKIEESNG